MVNLDELSDFSVIKLKDFLKLTGWGRTTLWRRLKEGKTPKMLMEDGVCRGCTYKAYKEWINSLQQN